MMRRPFTRFQKRLLAFIVLSLLNIGLALVLVDRNIGNGLEAISFDFPFLFKEKPAPPGVVLVTIDETSHVDLNQPLNTAWDRGLHAELLNQLNEQGARLVMFDILFSGDHSADPEMEAAIRNFDGVILAGQLVESRSRQGITRKLFPPKREFRAAATGWGLVHLPADTDGIIRRFFADFETEFGLRNGFAAEGLTSLGKPFPEGPSFYINYYGPSPAIETVKFSHVLQEGGYPPGIFKDKIVLVGTMYSAGFPGEVRDSFETPFTGISRRLTAGVEIHATILANLLNGEFLQRLSMFREVLLISLIGILSALIGTFVRPSIGLPLCGGLAVLVSIAGVYTPLLALTWWAWTIPVMVLIPISTGLAVLQHYLLEFRGRQRFKKAFDSYISPKYSAELDSSEFTLKPGGRLRKNVTILFSDIAGFTDLTESLRDTPQVLSHLLTSYFDKTTDGILENEGVIHKFIGDAILASWRSMADDPRHAERAIQSAVGIQEVCRDPFEINAAELDLLAAPPNTKRRHLLKTRIGIHTGEVIVGNLGSHKRFDFSLLGDAVNFAARLESLNKQLGTQILISEDTMKWVYNPENFKTRYLGLFAVKGKKIPVGIYEVLGMGDRVISDRSVAFLEAFAAGQAAFTVRDWEQAIGQFSSEPLKEDLTASLYLNEISRLKKSPPGEDWTGFIRLDKK